MTMPLPVRSDDLNDAAVVRQHLVRPLTASWTRSNSRTLSPIASASLYGQPLLSVSILHHDIDANLACLPPLGADRCADSITSRLLTVETVSV